MCILDHTQNTFFCLGTFLKKLADDQCPSITKGSIYITHYVHYSTYILLAWKWIDQKFDVLHVRCRIFHICTYCIFTLWGRIPQMTLLFKKLLLLASILSFSNQYHFCFDLKITYIDWYLNSNGMLPFGVMPHLAQSM